MFLFCSSSPYDHGSGVGLQRSRTNSFGAPQYPPRNSKAALLLPGRMTSSKAAAKAARPHHLDIAQDSGAGRGLKSRSVEHLAQHQLHGLGLKAANSEVALIQKAAASGQAKRLKGTHSELNVSRQEMSSFN